MKLFKIIGDDKGINFPATYNNAMKITLMCETEALVSEETSVSFMVHRTACT